MDRLSQTIIEREKGSFTEPMGRNQSGFSEMTSKSSIVGGVPRNMSMVQPGTIIENKPLFEEVYRCIS